VSISFNIDAWAAWAPGLDTQDAWRAWAASPVLPTGDARPDLPEMAPMARRRVERLGRIALQAAYRAVEDAHHPLIFASRHGDVVRSTAMLRELAIEGTVSPASFSLSVHNAIGALFSIVRGDTARLSAVSAGVHTAEHALVEACGLLHEGAEKVIVVMYDEPPPAVHDAYQDEPAASYAWALRLTRAGNATHTLSCEAPQAGESASPWAHLPRGLQAWRYLLSNDGQWRAAGSQHDWVWRRHG
jgi:hypothetical protein